MIDAPHATVVTASHVCKSFGAHHALRGVSLSFAPRRCHALLGPNASGKTTLLRIIAGLLDPDEGRVHCLGHDVVQDRQAYLPKIGYVPQQFCYYDELTLSENLRFIANMRDIRNAPAVIDRAMQEFDLASCGHARAGTLSGGQRQRLMLAGALLHKPALLLLDEPTTALDSRSRAALWRCIGALLAGGVTVIMTTHEEGDAALCDSSTSMADGSVVST
jgi:ABC-2 type transport system ATP-binding protein